MVRTGPFTLARRGRRLVPENFDMSVPPLVSLISLFISTNGRSVNRVDEGCRLERLSCRLPAQPLTRRSPVLRI